MMWKKKGNRIRASDKSLVYHFCIGWLLLLFVAVFLLLNLRQLLVTDWKEFNLLHAGITWTAYNSITVLIATGICVLVTFLYYRYGYDRIKRLFHRQKLARMVLENKWYEPIDRSKITMTHFYIIAQPFIFSCFYNHFRYYRINYVVFVL